MTRRTSRARGLFSVVVAAAGAILLVAGCAITPPASQEPALRELATRYVRAAMEFPDNPAVRAQAVEAAGYLDEQGRLLVRERLKDEHPGVRFAACMTIGRMQDRSAMPVVRPLLQDSDGSVRIAAYYALERLGDSSYRRVWVDALTKGTDVAVRRNAAFALGQLESKEVMPLLQTSLTKDDDEGVRLQALEAMAILGDRQSVQRFIHDAYGGVGYRQTFALLTLGKSPDDRVIGTLRKRLAEAPHLEARLAAARALGMKGYRDGFELALASIDWNQPQANLPDDPPENQVMRMRSMAAMALGEIRDRRALGALKRRMQTPDDSRVQLAAATAMLMILESPPGSAGPA